MFWYKCVVILYVVFFVFFFKQKTAYEMRISDWSSDVCSSDLARRRRAGHAARPRLAADRAADRRPGRADDPASRRQPFAVRAAARGLAGLGILPPSRRSRGGVAERSEEHTSELQSLMRISYAVFCLKTKKLKRRTRSN